MTSAVAIGGSGLISQAMWRVALMAAQFAACRRRRASNHHEEGV